MSEFYKPLDGKKQLQEMMMNDTPTPETDHLESNLGYAAHPVLLYLCRKLESERDKARKELTAVTEQRDRLADILNQCLQAIPCGYIPNHTVENIPTMIQNQSANIAKEINRGESLEEQRDRLAVVVNRWRKGKHSGEYGVALRRCISEIDEALQSINPPNNA